MSISLIVLIEVQAGKAEEQVEAFAQLAPLVRAEAGCIEYRLHRVAGDENRFVITEEWESEAALAAHGSAPHMVKAASRNKLVRAGPAQIVKLLAV